MSYRKGRYYLCFFRSLDKFFENKLGCIEKGENGQHKVVMKVKDSYAKLD